MRCSRPPGRRQRGGGACSTAPRRADERRPTTRASSLPADPMASRVEPSPTASATAPRSYEASWRPNSPAALGRPWEARAHRRLPPLPRRLGRAARTCGPRPRHVSHGVLPRIMPHVSASSVVISGPSATRWPDRAPHSGRGRRPRSPRRPLAVLRFGADVRRLAGRRVASRRPAGRGCLTTNLACATNCCRAS